MQKLLTFILLLLTFAACVDDEVGGFVPSQITATTNAKDGSFCLGRVLAGNGTSTKTLMLYNKSDKAVEFDSLVLRRAEHFRINVDGMQSTVGATGQRYTNPAFLHIQKEDSMYILVDVIFPLHEGNSPRTYRDTIDIYGAGLSRHIALSATAIPVQQVRDSVITGDVTWGGAEAARQVFGQLTIAKGATLNVTDSMTLYMHLGSGIVVDGTLNINGHSYQQSVTLCGDRLDSLFVNLAYRDMPSQWGGIVNRGKVVASNARILGMTDGLRTESLDDENTTILDCTSCVLSNSDSILVNARKTNISLTNCLVTNGAMGLFRAEDSNVNLAYCTFANYCYWYATTRPDVELVITKEQKNKTALLNTLIYGRWVNPSIQINDEVKFTPELGERLNVKMDSCRYDINPSYILDDRKNYLLDAHVADSSVCRKSALPLPDVTLDLEGKPRDPHKPTIGCYE